MDKSKQGWVRDTVSLDAISQEMQRRQGVQYPWGDWKREPGADACQCKECSDERSAIKKQAQKRAEQLSCPQRVCKEEKPKQTYLDYYRSSFLTSSFFGGEHSSCGDSHWDEVTKEADKRKIEVSQEPVKGRMAAASSEPELKSKRVGNMVYYFDKHGKFVTGEKIKK